MGHYALYQGGQSVVTWAEESIEKASHITYESREGPTRSVY